MIIPKNANPDFQNVAENYDMLSYYTLKKQHFTGVINSIKNHQNQLLKDIKGITVKVDSEHYKVMFGTNFDGYLYRGENSANNLFRSSFQRLNGIDKCIEWCKTQQFIKYLKQTPYYTHLPNYLQCDGYKFLLDTTAIAQHYGFKTNYLDFTQNREVAEFFAYTKWENGAYKPIQDFTQKIKIYNVDFSKLVEKNEKYFQIVGFQIAGRAIQQEAYAIDMSDINKLDLSVFNHEEYIPDPDRVKEIYEKFEGGKKLFPDDVLGLLAEKMDIDTRRNGKTTISNLDLIDYCQLFKEPYGKIRCAVSKRCNIVPYDFMPCKEINDFMENKLMEIVSWANKNIQILREFSVGSRAENHIDFIEAQTTENQGIAMICDLIKK